MNLNGYVYICSFSNGMLKVGMSRNNPDGRIKAHSMAVSLSGATLVDSWISPPHQTFKENEKVLIEQVSSHKHSSGREWCSGINFKQLVSFAKSLNFEVATSEQSLIAEKNAKDRTNLCMERLSSMRCDHIFPDRKWIASTEIACVLQGALSKASSHEPIDELQKINGNGFLSEFHLFASIHISQSSENEVADFMLKSLSIASTHDADLIWEFVDSFMLIARENVAGMVYGVKAA